MILLCNKPNADIEVPLIKLQNLNCSRNQMWPCLMWQVLSSNHQFWNLNCIKSVILSLREVLQNQNDTSTQHLFDRARYILSRCSLPVSHSSHNAMPWPLKGQRSHQTHDRQLNMCDLCHVDQTCQENWAPFSSALLRVYETWVRAGSGVKSQNWIPGSKLL